MLTLVRQWIGPTGHLLALRLILGLGGLGPLLAAAEAIRKPFALPAAAAEVALETFSEQADVQLVYLFDDVRGVATNPLQGTFAVREALERLVAGTRLRVEQEGTTGAFVIKRGRPAGPPAEVARNHESIPEKTMKRSPLTRLTAVLATFTSSVLSAQTAPALLASSTEPVLLSPFEVTAAGDRGYYGANTMSGTRLNSRIEDLASSITVVTKEQMADFAMLDINDIFNYEAGTEGTGNFTDLEFNANGDPVDNSQLDPNNANRIRGLGPANVSFGNFATSGREPLDPINIDAIEISRGPNSNIFGLGSAAGTINSVPATANLGRERSQIQFRADSYDGYRGSVDLNRVLKKGVLAIRGSAVYQHDGFVRKPSGTDTVRLNGMLKYQPFKSTTLTASYSTYRMHGNRPNTTPPRDAITYWRKSGSPTWDPLTQTAYRNGVATVYPGGSTGNTNPSYFTNALMINNGGGSSIVNVDTDGKIMLWTPARATTTNNPLTQDQVGYRYVTTNPENFRSTQPLFLTALSISDKADYDWSSINLAAMNYQAERTNRAVVQLEHFFYRSQHQVLGLQTGWYHEDSKSLQRLVYGTPSVSGTSGSRANSGYLFVDPNIRLLDGRPNPNFLRPNIGVSSPATFERPLANDTYRGQLVYQIDLTREKNLLRWAGLHQVSGYTEYQERIARQFRYQDAIMSDHPWIAPGIGRANSSGSGAIQNRVSPTGTRVYYQYYVGDNIGQNVDVAPHGFDYGVYPYSWGNAATGNFVQEPALLAPGADNRSTAGTNNLRTVLKTTGAVLQSHYLDGRLITTFGVRQDKNFVMRGVTPSLMPDGKTHDYDNDRRWTNEWEERQGRTKTAGVVVAPLRWVRLHLNKSDAFRPVSPAQDLHLRPLPNPSGLGTDYGFSLNLFEGKLGVRVNRYETKQINSRNGASTSLATTVRRMDIYGGSTSQPFGLDFRSRNWLMNSAAREGVTLTEEQLDAKVAEVMKLSVEHLKGLQDLDAPIAATDDVLSRGTELELHFNPNLHWTLKINATRQETLTTAIAPDLVQWITERLPVWESVIDADTGRPWYTTGYLDGGTGVLAANYLRSNVTTQLGLTRQTEGKARPQIRKYRFNLSTNYRLAGITDHRWLRRFNVGGGLRWEDKGAIGYYGVQQLPDIITELDPNRPVWSKANYYIDAFVGYRTRLFRDKVGATVQLNVRNLQESGRLQAISAMPDGTPNAYRIIDPRQFILTVTFDL